MENQNINVTEEIRSLYAPNLFQNKVVLVTGGSRGIGRAVSISFAALGAKVIVNYMGNASAAKSTVEEIEKNNGQAIAVQFDVSQFNATQEAIKSLEKEHGGIDILINNAGISRDNLFVKFKEEDWDTTLNINLKGVFNCSRAVAMGMMRKRSGKIINLSSVVGLAGSAGQTAYAASKAGVIGFTKSLALELASRNVQVNAIAPGYISTDMTGALGQDLIQKVLEKIPAQKLGEGVEIAKSAIFLASSAASYITGQTLAVDGGMTMH